MRPLPTVTLGPKGLLSVYHCRGSQNRCNGKKTWYLSYDPMRGSGSPGRVPGVLGCGKKSQSKSVFQERSHHLEVVSASPTRSRAVSHAGDQGHCQNPHATVTQPSCLTLWLSAVGVSALCTAAAPNYSHGLNLRKVRNVLRCRLGVRRSQWAAVRPPKLSPSSLSLPPKVPDSDNLSQVGTARSLSSFLYEWYCYHRQSALDRGAMWLSAILHPKGVRVVSPCILSATWGEA